MTESMQVSITDAEGGEVTATQIPSQPLNRIESDGLRRILDHENYFNVLHLRRPNGSDDSQLFTDLIERKYNYVSQKHERAGNHIVEDVPQVADRHGFAGNHIVDGVPQDAGDQGSAGNHIVEGAPQDAGGQGGAGWKKNIINHKLKLAYDELRETDRRKKFETSLDSDWKYKSCGCWKSCRKNSLRSILIIVALVVCTAGFELN